VLAGRRQHVAQQVEGLGKAAGVQFDSPLQRQPWATQAVFRDPDGNMLVLQQA
jgi:glyoxalase/bleomycin resistance protein/dioxygenase superfamily protein